MQGILTRPGLLELRHILEPGLWRSVGASGCSSRNAARFVALAARAAMDAVPTNTGHQGDSANERGGGGEGGPQVDNARPQGADACGWCGASEAKQLCSACKAVKYCGKECQVRVHASRQPCIVDGHAAFEHCMLGIICMPSHVTSHPCMHTRTCTLIASPAPHPHSHSHAHGHHIHHEPSSLLMTTTTTTTPCATTAHINFVCDAAESLEEWPQGRLWWRKV
jgi:hypothetical protein